jgi:hypothetical protein
MIESTRVVGANWIPYAFYTGIGLFAISTILSCFFLSKEYQPFPFLFMFLIFMIAAERGTAIAISRDNKIIKTWIRCNAIISSTSIEQIIRGRSSVNSNAPSYGVICEYEYDILGKKYSGKTKLAQFNDRTLALESEKTFSEDKNIAVFANPQNPEDSRYYKLTKNGYKPSGFMIAALWFLRFLVLCIIYAIVGYYLEHIKDHYCHIFR